MLIDTHAHVNFHSFKDDTKETLQRTLDAGVQVINIGSNIGSSQQAVEIANQFDKGVYAVVGLHPDFAYPQHDDEEAKTTETEFDYEAYKKLAENPKVVGIGECGLDYYRLPDDADHQPIKDKQKTAFRQQIKLARESNRALVVHSRPAKGDESLYDELLEILDSESVVSSQLSVVPFVVHSFTGSPEHLQKFLDRGAYVSFNGIITFDKTGNMEKLVKLAPLDKIVLETDCPFLTPVPHRGKRNEPQYVSYVAQRVAEIKNLSAEEIAEKTFANSCRLFGLAG